MAVSVPLVALLTNCLIFWPMAVTAMSSVTIFKDTGRNDVIFNGFVVFERNVASVLSCAYRGVQAGCLAFTFTKEGWNPRHCHGYNDSFVETSTDVTAQVGAKTYKVRQPAPPAASGDACSNINYVTLTDIRYHVGSDGALLIPPLSVSAGWYRFVLNGNNAVLMTVSPGYGQVCATTEPVWFDPEGQSLPTVGAQTVGAKCRFDFSTAGCDKSLGQTITVRNCGNYYIYDLQPVAPTENYCATDQV